MNTSMSYQYEYRLIEQNLNNFGESSIYWFIPEILMLFGIIFQIGVIGLSVSDNQAITILYKMFNLLLGLSSFILILQIIVLVLEIYNIQASTGILENTFQINIYTQVLKLLINFNILFLTPYFSSIQLSQFINAKELPLLLCISAFLIYIIISITHYVLLLLALEGFSLILYILTMIDRSRGGVTAGTKYFTFGTLGSIFLFWSTAHLYSLVPSLTYNVITLLQSTCYSLNNDMMLSSFEFAETLFLVGLLIKFGAAPVHQWVADVYAGVHTSITAYFSTVVKLVIFSVFSYLAYYFIFTSIINVFAISSLLVGTFATLKQLEIKRFLAYSSITHVGFLLIGDLPSTYIYILTYLCSSLLFFSVILSNTNENNIELIYITDLRFIKSSGHRQPILLIIALASMAGLPPFAGFFGKFLIWGSLIEDIYLFNNTQSYLFFFISLVLTLITIFYYIRIIIYLYVSSDYEIGDTILTHNQSFTIKSQQAILSNIIVMWMLYQPLILTILLICFPCWGQ